MVASSKRGSASGPTGPGKRSARLDSLQGTISLPPGEQFIDWLLGPSNLLEQVFDSLPDVLFYIKDTEGRYLWVNHTLVERSGLTGRAAVIGKTADELFPVSGSSTTTQDMELIRTQRPVRERLRLYRTSNGRQYWCLSSKFPMRNTAQQVVGLVGFSRDLPRSNERHRSYKRLARFLEYVELHFDQNVLITEAAKAAAVSVDTVARLVLEVFHLTPRQLLLKKRIDKACELLEDTSRSITEVSCACGYGDHSAFTRQFKSATGITPTTYRTAHKSAAAIV